MKWCSGLVMMQSNLISHTLLLLVNYNHIGKLFRYRVCAEYVLTQWLSNFIFRLICRRNVYKCLPHNMYKNFHTSIVYNWKLEITQKCTNKRMDRCIHMLYNTEVNKLQLPTTTQMNFTSILLNKRNQKQIIKCMLSFT